MYAHTCKRSPRACAARMAPSGGRARGGEELRGALPVERLAWPVVDLCGDPHNVLDGVDAQVGALREVVAQQPVHVLVAAPLPWRVRVAEEHVGAGRDGDPLVLRELLALIPGTRSS